MGMQIVVGCTEARLMTRAIHEAKKATMRGDYFFGAVVAREDEIIAAMGNRVKKKMNSARHVELEVILKAADKVKDRYLYGCTLYSTCEPCFMCLGAAYWAGISAIIYGISQDDLKEFGEKHGDKQFRYRPSPISSLTLTRLYDIPIPMEQLMRDQCLTTMGETLDKLTPRMI